MNYRLDLSLTGAQYIEVICALQERRDRLTEAGINTRSIERAEQKMRAAYKKAIGEA